MVIAYDGIHVERHGAGSPDFGPRVLDGNSDRRRQRTAVVTGRHYDGPNRPKTVRVFDRADNASRLDIDTDRSAGKDLLFYHRREIDRNALSRSANASSLHLYCSGTGLTSRTCFTHIQLPNLTYIPGAAKQSIAINFKVDHVRFYFKGHAPYMFLNN